MAAGGATVTVAIALARALTGSNPATLILNVRNQATVAALPDEAVIETVCRVDATGAASAGRFPRGGSGAGQRAVGATAVIDTPW